MIESARGIVLRRKKDRESDAVITLLCEDGRLLRARFHGILQSKTRSNLTAEPGSHVELVLQSKDASIASVKEGTLLERNDAWKSGYRPLSLLSSVLEFAEGMASACDSDDLYRLIAGGMEEARVHARLFEEPESILFFTAIRIRGLTIAGLTGDLSYCASCGERLGKQARWSVPEISFLCNKCSDETTEADARAAHTLARMAAEAFPSLLSVRQGDNGYIDHLKRVEQLLAICIRHALPFPSPAADALTGGPA
jgi:DNA repair protein RecO